MAGISSRFSGNFLSKLVNYSIQKTCPQLSGIILLPVRNFSAEVTVAASPAPIAKKKISKAMKAYLERAREHDEFMKTESLNYQIGKRHLANMMGEDPENFTQADIDRSIEYLFPSGIFDPKARPLMKPPEEVFPAKKAAEFDETGRPHHTMFYTGKPNFFKLLYDIVEEINKQTEFEDRMIRKGISPDPNLKLELSSSTWLPKDKLEIQLVEKLADIEYRDFVNALERLIAQPYAYKSKEFIDKHRKVLLAQASGYVVPKPQFDENGRMFVTTYECLRKRARGHVTLRSPGTGLITINGQDINYFQDTQPREQKYKLWD